MIYHINFIELKDKNNMINSTDAEKVFDKIQYLFTIKILQEVGIEGTYLNITKDDIANIILNGEKSKAFPLKSGQDKGAHPHHYYST